MDEIEMAMLGSRQYRNAARETNDPSKASHYWGMVALMTDLALMAAVEEGAGSYRECLQ